MNRVALCLSAAILVAPFARGQSFETFSTASAQRALIDHYCTGCHNDKLKSGGLSLVKLEKTLDDAQLGHEAQEWEKAVLKLKTGMMPPAGAPRPDAAALKAFAASLETALDHAATPNPGRPALHRLNRAEYANSIHDLLDLDIDPAQLLPTDDSSHGFDNMAEVLTISPTLMDGYIRAAGEVSRLAVGDPGMSPLVVTYHVPQAFSQMHQIDGAPLGTRGGIVVRHNFPADGEYVFKMTFYYASIGALFGNCRGCEGEQIEVAINGERVALLDINQNLKVDQDVRTPPIKVKAGPQVISAAFIKKFDGTVQDSLQPFEYALSDLSTGHIPGLTGLPHLRDMGISGPLNATGPGNTPSRAKIFICRPANTADEVPCATKIISSLVRQAYRRPVTETDKEELLSVFQSGRNKGDFESGIRLVVQTIIADPQFVFRIEQTPASAAPGAIFRVSDLELASRLSYFLWSSAPDEQLISLASQGKLRDPKVLEQQVRRMVADPRSEALAVNFAAQWLGLRNLKDSQPDNYLFVDFDKNLADSMLRETELFFDSIVHEDRDIVDLLTANYSFVDERLAIHYGIPNVVGTRFRRVTLTDPNRFGLLGQGSILTLTSLPTRTSPVERGKWVLEQILGTNAPTPPPNVPPLKSNTEGAQQLSVRERMQQHRQNEPCHSCHQIMDPLGFSLENFDATGAWRIHDSGFSIDPSGQLYEGTKVNGPADLRNALVKHSDAFVQAFTVKLLTYALGRGVEYYDMPVVRSIDRAAAKNDNRFMSIVLGIVNSTPFQMSVAPERQTTSAAAHNN